MITVTDADAAIHLILSAAEEVRTAMADLEYWDARTQDILHDLELVEHTDTEIVSLGLQLREARRCRRAAKDAIEELTPLAELLENTFARKYLTEALGRMRKAEEKHRNRVYFRRTEGKGEMIGGQDNAD